MIARERVQPERQHQSVVRVDQREERAVRLAVTRLAQLPAAGTRARLELPERRVHAQLALLEATQLERELRIRIHPLAAGDRPLG